VKTETELRMELTPTSGKAFTNAGQTMEYRISNENAGFIMDILATKLYSDPLMAPIREIVTNAFDAHLMSGKRDVPVNIRAPAVGSPTFVVRDFGPGIAPEKMASFFSFGDSDKRHSNEATGGFGIGSKSPFAIADSFTTVIFVNGMKYIWQSFKKEGKPNSALLHSEATTEPSGVEVQIPVHGKDLESFNVKLLSFLTYVQSPYKIDSLLKKLPVPFRSVKDDNGLLLHLYRDTGSRTGWLVRMGDIAYKIPPSMLLQVPTWNHCFLHYKTSLSQDVSRWVNNYFPFRVQQDTVIVDLPIGSLTISPNREEIIDTAKNAHVLAEFFLKRLDSRLAKMHQEFCAQYSSDLGTFMSSFFSTSYFTTHYEEKLVISNYIKSVLLSPTDPTYVRLGLEKYFGRLNTKIIESFFSSTYSKSFHTAFMSDPRFINDTGLVFRAPNSSDFVVPKSIEHSHFFESNRLKRKHTSVQLGDNLNNASKVYASCFDAQAKGFIAPTEIFAGRYVGGNPGYKSLTGRYFVTKTLSEITDPVYRWFVAYFFLNTTFAEVEPTVAVPKKRKLVLATEEEIPPLYRFIKGWEPYTTYDKNKPHLILRYSTGASNTFSQDPGMTALTAFSEATYPTSRLRSAMASIADRQSFIVVALRHDMEVPADIKDQAYTISDLSFGVQALRIRDQSNSTGAYEYFKEHVLGKSFYKAILSWSALGSLGEYFAPRDELYTKRTFGYLPLINKDYALSSPPPRMELNAPLHTGQNPSNLYDYVLVHTPIDPTNVKLTNHLKTYYSNFLRDGRAPLYMDAFTKLLKDPTYFSNLTLFRFLPLLVASYFEKDLDAADTLFKDLWPCYIQEVLAPLMAAYIPKLEKR
jgi:hypothetical protein